uniref:RAD51-associated protein 1 isoform X2 n=1 Tax=Geotrypetes seraphini TaxID=260995 RepID=A0A6P8RN02_GEOSA|nr:RAD51-associated protein 1 isoform X2 [Geotrypetes seraphini]
MDRPARNKKIVDYSQFDNDDEDFTCATAPPSKKSKVAESKKEKKKLLKKSQTQEMVPERKPQVERLSVKEKLYQRDLEVALALSVQERPAGAAPETGIEKCASSEAEGMAGAPFSNCSVDSVALELDKITNVQDYQIGGRRRRAAASRAMSEQKKLLMHESDADRKAEEEEEQDSTANEASESESSFSDEDEEFSVKRGKKAKESKKKHTELKVKAEEKRKKSPGCKMNITVTPVATAPRSVKEKSPKKTPVSPEAVGKPLQVLSSPGTIRKPMWTPPGLCSSFQ